jgi:hypothetical protein
LGFFCKEYSNGACIWYSEICDISAFILLLIFLLILLYIFTRHLCGPRPTIHCNGESTGTLFCLFVWWCLTPLSTIFQLYGDGNRICDISAFILLLIFLLILDYMIIFIIYIPVLVYTCLLAVSLYLFIHVYYQYPYTCLHIVESSNPYYLFLFYIVICT